MTRYAITVGVLLALLACTWQHGNYYGHKSERLKWLGSVASSVKEALAIERDRQRGVNNALQKQADNLADINAALTADLNRLRDRPVRVRTVIHPRPACAGGSGAELSREDASFLVGEAARCDTIRAGLLGCYAAYDALSSH